MPATDRSREVTAPGLVVRPFRGLRYDPAKVSNLAAVTSPPYDVIDPDAAEHLADLDPHNVVRLILPRAMATPTGEARSPVVTDGYEEAKAALETWQREGVLRRDDQPTLYAYEQQSPSLVQRGLLAAVALRDAAARVILPHEDVMPGPVADRLALMRTTASNLEPILLVYEGGGDTAAVLEEVCAGEPIVQTTTEDGVAQRLWAVTDPELQRRVAADLLPRQALIADGHHRYATYRRLQAEHHDAGDGAGEWDYGLAMLVDSVTHPLRVHAIHRVVGRLDLADAQQRASTVFQVRDAGPDLPSALGALQAAAGEHPFLLTDGERYVLLEDPDPREVDEALPAGEHSPDWRDLDASVLHALLLARLWGVEDSPERTAYVHDASAAVRQARRSRGVAVLLRPVTVEVVHELAARGERMPRKSTSFGPKPRTGLVLRLLDP